MKLYIFVLSLFGAWMLASCSKMDDFTKYTNGQEQIYPAKLDSIKVRSGKYRVQIEGVFRVSTGISEIRVYWNSKQDSMRFPVQLKNANDTVRCLIENLPEGPMNFEVRTLDPQGRLSIPTNLVGSIYGERYREGLFQRSVVQQNFVAGQQLQLVTQDVAATMGADAMRIKYKKDDGKMIDTLVKTKSQNAQILLSHYALNSELSYQTIFRPDSNAIDTFVVQPTKLIPKGDITAWYLKNFKKPFTSVAYDGNRWGTLNDWITNSSMKNHNGFGGFASDDGGVVNVEAGWGAPAILNGKIEQQVTLLPGKYRFFCTLSATNYDQPPAYLVISKSNKTIPDWEQINDALLYTEVKSDGIYFDIKEKVTVNMGMLLNFQPDHYMKIDAFQITLQ